MTMLTISRRSLFQSAAATALAAGAARAQTVPHLTHQLGWIKSVQFGGHFAALEQGYFTAAGVDATFNAGGPGVEPRTVVASGRATTSDLNATGIVIGRGQGMPIRAFAAVMQRDPGAILSLTEKPIKTIGDMAGKTIAVPNSIRPTLAVLFKRNKIDPDRVTLVPVGTDPGMLAAKQVDGYYGWATNQGTMLRSRGVDIHVVTLNELGVPGYANVLFATDETIDKQGDVLAKWLRADRKGWQWMVDHPAETAKLTVEKYGPPGLDLAAQTAEAQETRGYITGADTAAKGLLWMEPGVFEDSIAFARDSGAIPADSKLQARDVMTQDVLRAAAGPV